MLWTIDPVARPGDWDHYGMVTREYVSWLSEQNRGDLQTAERGGEGVSSFPPPRAAVEWFCSFSVSGKSHLGYCCALCQFTLFIGRSDCRNPVNRSAPVRGNRTIGCAGVG